jgi:hypothetical protein
MPRNPSELERLEQERAFYFRELKRYQAKGAKELLLAQLHEVEKRLGLPLSRYNSSDFGKK